MAACTIDLNLLEEYIVKFVATIEIPIGFEPYKNPETQGWDSYSQYLSVDVDAVFPVIDEIPATADEISITLPDGTEKIINCPNINIPAIYLRGPLFYNAVATGFHSAISINSEGVPVSDLTAFSESRPIQVDIPIMIACPGTQFLPSDIQNIVANCFDVSITKGQERVYTETGTEAIYDPVDPTEFLESIKTSGTQFIRIPYTIQLTPKTVQP